MFRIIGPNSDPHSAAFQTVFDALEVLPGVAEVFRTKMAPALWNAAQEYCLDGVGLIAQSALETAWGTFRKADGRLGAVQEWFHNPAGIKIRYPDKWKSLSGLDAALLSPDLRALRDNDPTVGDKPLAHQQFPSWPKGALAMAQHVYIYTGGRVDIQDVDDPRWWLVEELRQGKPPLKEWSDFGSGNWAGGIDYGRNIEGIMSKLHKGKNQ